MYFPVMFMNGTTLIQEQAFLKILGNIFSVSL
jgi:hypothetical protein